MSEKIRYVTEAYEMAEKAAKDIDLGWNDFDLVKMLKSAYTHGYAQALIDRNIGVKEEQ